MKLKVGALGILFYNIQETVTREACLRRPMFT